MTDDLKPGGGSADEDHRPLARPVPMSDEHLQPPPPPPAPPQGDGTPELHTPPPPPAPPAASLVRRPGTDLKPVGASSSTGVAMVEPPTTSTALGPVRRRTSRTPVLAGIAAALVIAGGALAASGALGGDDDTASAAGGQVASRPADTGAADTEDGMAPLPKSRARLVEPVAGETSEAPVKVQAARASDGRGRQGRPKITGPATIDNRQHGSAGVTNLQADKATALPNGVALPPLEAPEAVLDVIRAGNIIARTPYKWGGGHGRFQDNGYDCSGSVSYALYYAGLLDGPHTSGELMAYGKPGPGKWITIYANGGHVYMTVAGIGFDTSAASSTNRNSRWRNEMRNNAGFEVRHPAGL